MSGIDEQPEFFKNELEESLFIQKQRKKQLKMYKKMLENNGYKIANTYIYLKNMGDLIET